MKSPIRNIIRYFFAAALVCLTGLNYATNPVITNKYTADPAAMVYKDKVYISIPDTGNTKVF